MSDLEEIFQKQSHLQETMGNPLGQEDEGIKNAMLALTDEAHEVLNEVNWKPWKKTKKIVNADRLHEELCDCLQFVVNGMLIAEMNHEDVMNILERKWIENHKRVRENY